NRCAAGRGLEEADAGRVPSADHIGARYVQSEALGVIEATVFSGRQVVDAFDVFRPIGIGWIERAGDNEFLFSAFPCGFDEKLFECGLAVRTVSSEIAHEPLSRALFRKVNIGVDGAVEGPCHTRSILALDSSECGSTSEGEIHAIAGNFGDGEVLVIS